MTGDSYREIGLCPAICPAAILGANIMPLETPKSHKDQQGPHRGREIIDQDQLISPTFNRSRQILRSALGAEVLNFVETC
jgi:hypothetical protein